MGSSKKSLLSRKFEFSKKKRFLENNDIKPEDFIENPKSIMPHFLVPDHPLSKRLLEEDKLTKQLGFDKF